mgnify:FL=1
MAMACTGPFSGKSGMPPPALELPGDSDVNFLPSSVESGHPSDPTLQRRFRSKLHGGSASPGRADLLEADGGGPAMKVDFSPDPSLASDLSRICDVCGKSPASFRLPFAVGRQETPPQPRKYRIFRMGPMRRKFFQRHRWVWHILWLCRDCGSANPSDRLWSAIQNHPATRQLVEQGYTETRLDPGFQGREEEVTFTEEPV